MTSALVRAGDETVAMEPSQRVLTAPRKEAGRLSASYGSVIAQLEALYRACLPDFCRAAAAIAGDRGLGEDAVQEAFAKALRKRRHFRGDGPLEAWVWRIVVNCARDARRRRPRSERLQQLATCNGHSPTLPLELLTNRQREVLFLRYYADLDYAAIGAALGISPGTVGATLTNARHVLKEALAPEVTER
jgi:DNA-directed RNA polymerase specialized sigma24 family protein